MKKIFFSAFFLYTQICLSQSITLQTRPHDLGIKGAVKAPEGISISPSGTVYTTSMRTGKIYAARAPDFKPVEIINLGKLKGWKAAKQPKALGILAESEQQLWVALPEVWGGCIYSIRKSNTHFTAKPALCGAGDVNGLVVDKARNRLYASSRVMGMGTGGMIITIALDQLKTAVKNSKPISYSPQKHLLVKADMPNGLVLSGSRNFLIFAQTMKDRVSAVSLKTKRVHTVFKSNESGWLDGLIYLKDKDLYIVTDSKLGKLHFFKFDGQLVKTIKVLNPEGVSTGLASIVRSGDRLYVTDLWRGDLYAKVYEVLTGSDEKVRYHSRVYNFSLNELMGF